MFFPILHNTTGAAGQRYFFRIQQVDKLNVPRWGARKAIGLKTNETGDNSPVSPIGSLYVARRVSFQPLAWA
ncbi:hypothetical protein SP90_13270 [Halodesulfovibrio spirochaetisodalis]|uniref:Uncharacterized protein n=1 Tax=Halodesulfovibrio spirochaetisodalis TaxID=1560234 RepID=A0A1B7XAA0_9BACT|nr:hypothetical protein SP90_13270 [Halodesulfovibrio spirochaetisodalis]